MGTQIITQPQTFKNASTVMGAAAGDAAIAGLTVYGGISASGTVYGSIPLSGLQSSSASNGQALVYSVSANAWQPGSVVGTGTGAAAAPVVTRYTFSNNTTSAFAVSGYTNTTASNYLVFLDGVCQAATVDYSLSATSTGGNIVLTSPAASGVVANVLAYQTTIASAASGLSPVSNDFTGNGTVSAYAINGYTNTQAEGYLVHVGGLYQRPGVNYTASAGNITFTTPPPSGAPVTILAYQTMPGNVTYGSSVPGNFSVGNALTVSNGLTASGSVVAPGLTVTPGQITDSMMFRNRLINGNMAIDQRNAGASVTPADGAYTVDRWQAGLTQSSKFSVQQNAGAISGPIGLPNYLGATSLSTYTVLAGDTFRINQAIEGVNFADFGWGSASASPVTLSFWVRSNLIGTFGGSLRNSASNRSYPFTYTITTASTWEQKTVVIAGDTSGTWVGATNGIGVNLAFSLGSGATFSGTAGVWAAANYTSATGTVSVVGTNAATLYITGVQLEKGTTSTPFEFRPYGTELALCQRYYEAGSGAYIIGSATSGLMLGGTISFNTSKRATPVVTLGTPTENTNLGSINITPQSNAFRMHSLVTVTGNAYWSGPYTATAEL